MSPAFSRYGYPVTWPCAGLTSLLTALLSSAGGLAFLEADAASVRLLMDVLSPGMSTAPLLLRAGDEHRAAGCALLPIVTEVRTKFRFPCFPGVELSKPRQFYSVSKQTKISVLLYVEGRHFPDQPYCLCVALRLCTFLGVWQRFCSRDAALRPLPSTVRRPSTSAHAVAGLRRATRSRWRSGQS